MHFENVNEDEDMEEVLVLPPSAQDVFDTIFNVGMYLSGRIFYIVLNLNRL